MTAVVLPFLMTMLLGRTIDLRTYSTAGNIYDDADFVETPLNKMSTSYSVLQSNAYPYSDMGLPVDLVLRLKTNYLGSRSGFLGLEDLLRDLDWKTNSAIVAIMSATQTVERTLKKDAVLISNWQQRIPDSMTHFAHSVYYGGWRVVLFRFKCKMEQDVQPVRDTLTSILGAHGDFNNQTIERFYDAIEAVYANPEVRNKVTLQTRIYSSHPSKHTVELPSDLTIAISSLSSEVGDIGKPLYMELLPLKALDEKYSSVEENHELDTQLEKLDELYDDVKNTKNLITIWLSETLTIFTVEQDEKILKLFAHLNICIKAFHHVAEEASVYRNMNKTVLESAFQLYVQGLEADALSYDQIFRRYKEEIDAECEDYFLQKVKGMLNVTENEVVELGELEGGFDECTKRCIAEPKCRSVGYADEMLKLVLVGDDESIGRFQMVKKERLCWIYFRSTSTATVTLPKGNTTVGVYDRQCY